MSGVGIVLQLLRADRAVLALTPDENIVGDTLPQGTPLNAIGIETVSSVDRDSLAPGGWRHVTERVQVTMLAATRPAAKAIRRAVRKAAADKMPLFDGVTDVVVRTWGGGADFGDAPSGIRIQTQDFRVSYNEPT